MSTANPSCLWTTDLDLRDRLRIGTVLETSDCAYLRVDAITPEGVICPRQWSPGALVSWQELERDGCVIYSQPGDVGHERFQTPLPRLIQRGGRLAMQVAHTTALPKLLGDEALERALARALACSAPPGWERIHLAIEIDWAREPGYCIVGCTADGPEEPMVPDAEVLALASALRAEARLLRGPLCSRVELLVERSGGQNYFETRVRYAGDPPD